MDAGFSIAIDPARKLLAVTFTGFFTPDALGTYLADKADALARLGCAPNDHVTLCDFSASGPQSQQVLEFFARSIADPAHRSRRMAVVVSSALAQLQVRRMVTRSGAACFLHRHDAEAWLTAELATLSA